MNLVALAQLSQARPSALPARLSGLLAFNPDEPRDEKGEWTDDGGGGAAVFVSPSVAESTRLDDAIGRLDSGRQKSFEALAQRVAQAVGGGGQVNAAVGVWSDGAENSTRVDLPKQTDTERAGYIGALLGRAAQQKDVLTFTRGASGPHALYSFKTSGDLRTIDQKLAQGGVAFRTLIPHGRNVVVNVVDMDGSAAAPLAKLANTEGWKVEAERGTAAFLTGEEDRDVAKGKYDDIIQQYEQRHPQEAYRDSLDFQGGGEAGIRDFRGRGAQASTQEVIRRIRALKTVAKPRGRWSTLRRAKQQRYGPSLWKQNPLRQIEKPDDALAFKQLPEKTRDKLVQHAPVRRFDPETLVTNQPVVYQADLEHFARHGFDPEPVIVLKSKAGLYVHNGNHRSTVALLSGKPVKARYIDLSKVKQIQAYAEDEPRDDHGEWTSGGAGSILFRKVGGAQGSNAGGVYVGKDGVTRYVKFYANPGQAHGEQLANTIYNDLGVKAPNSQIFKTSDGRTGFASDMISGGATLEEQGLNRDNARAVLQGFAADVLTGNWDALGLTYDNILMKDGLAHRVDNGASFLYRAQGSAKPDAALNQAAEIKGFFNPAVNWEYARLTQAAGYKSAQEIPGFRAQVDKIAGLERRSGGWGAYLDKKAPYLNASDRSRIASMLTSRTQALQAAAGISANAAASAAAMAARLVDADFTACVRVMFAFNPDEHLVSEQVLQQKYGGKVPELHRGLRSNETGQGVGTASAQNVAVIRNFLNVAGGEDYKFAFPMYGAEGYSSDHDVSKGFADGLEHGILISKAAGSVPPESVMSSRDLSPGMWSGYSYEHEWALAFPKSKLPVDTFKGDKVTVVASALLRPSRNLEDAVAQMEKIGWRCVVDEESKTIEVHPPAGWSSIDWFADVRRKRPKIYSSAPRVVVVNGQKMTIDSVSPPGWKGTTQHMKKHSEIDNPYPLAWWMYKHGDRSHQKPPRGTPKVHVSEDTRRAREKALKRKKRDAKAAADFTAPGAIERASLDYKVSKANGNKALAAIAHRLAGRTSYQGLPISIENPKGSVRSGINPATKQSWSVNMPYDYGYIKGTKGADGQGIDVFLGPIADAKFAYVVHQNTPDGADYDEDKCFLGFKSADAAKKAYCAAYDNGGSFFRSMSVLPMHEFIERVIRTRDLRRPGKIHAVDEEVYA